jgi:hypothetical protein
MKHRSFALASLFAGLALVASACATAPSGGGGGGAPNQPPVARLTADVTEGPAPLTVTFDATTSSDPDGTIINFFWDFGDGTSAPGGIASHTYAPGTWTAQLLVTDNKGATANDSVTIVATNSLPTAAFTVTPSGGAAPLNAVFDASGSVDPDGTIASYAWDFEELGTATGSSVSKSLPAGTLVVTLTVTDNNGATATTARSVTASGLPGTPTGLRKTGSGCCDTYGDFAWNIVAGADGYEVDMGSFFGGGCLTDASRVFDGQVSTGRVQKFGLCLGSKYDIRIRARANGVWGAWSGTTRITL